MTQERADADEQPDGTVGRYVREQWADAGRRSRRRPAPRPGPAEAPPAQPGPPAPPVARAPAPRPVPPVAELRPTN
ncbi:MAG TPA: hypothetical protein VF667_06210, partial [Pseudonocardia sp.]